MERSIKDLSKEELDRLEWIMFHACKNTDPWADMMYLHGAGDEGSTLFPLDLDEIERIDIEFVSREGSEGSMSDTGDGGESQSASSEETKSTSGTAGVGLSLGVNADVSGVTDTLGAVGGKVKDTAKKVKDKLH